MVVSSVVRWLGLRTSSSPFLLAETRKVVERAKSEMMTKYSMTEPQAFKWIQRTAMDHRMTMRDVAERILIETAATDESAES